MPKIKTTLRTKLVTKTMSYAAVSAVVFVLLTTLAGLSYAGYLQHTAQKEYNKNLEAAQGFIKNTDLNNLEL